MLEQLAREIAAAEAETKAAAEASRLAHQRHVDARNAEKAANDKLTKWLSDQLVAQGAKPLLFQEQQ